MAVAPEELAAAAAQHAVESPTVQRRVRDFETHPAEYVATGGPAGDQVRQLLSGSNTSILIRLVWAVALGLIVLEVLSQLTGRFFNWDLHTGWQNLKAAGKYVGLYPGQPAPTLPNIPTNTGASQYPYAAASSLQTATQPGIVNQPSPPGSIVAARGPNAPGFRA